MKSRSIVIAVSFAVAFAVGPVSPRSQASEPAISRGRQLILNRGIQIRSFLDVTGTPSFSDLSHWDSSRFTTLEFVNLGAQELNTLYSQTGPPRPWCRMHSIFMPGTEFLTSTEEVYLNQFVSFLYQDECRDVITADPNYSTLTPAERQADMATKYASWKTRYPNALAFANFGYWDRDPPYTVDELVGYMRNTQPDMLHFDYYPSGGTGDFSLPTRDAWYTTMQRYRTAALKGNDGTGMCPIAYGQYLDLYRNSYTLNLPSESYVRLQQFASWAFGYTNVSAYQYNNCGSVLFSADGDSTPTPVFKYVADTNRESRNLGPALVRLVSTDIRMIPGKVNGSTLSLPDGIATWASGNRNTGGHTDHITSITQRGKNNDSLPSNCSDVLIGYFKPLLFDNRSCTFVDGLTFMIVNGSTGTAFAANDAAGDPASKSAEWFRIDFDFGTSGFNSLARLSRTTGAVEFVTLQHLTGANGTLYRFDLQLDGGTGDLFRFWNSTNPLPTVL